MIAISAKTERITLITLLTIFFAIYTLQVVLNHFCFRSYALDYGFYNQAFWDFAHFRPNYNTVFSPSVRAFQVHPAFTLIFLSPLYWIFNPIFGTYSLLIIQNLFLVLGGLGTFYFIKHKTNHSLLALLAVFHYFVLWGHFSALSFEYIDVTVTSSTAPWFFYFFDRKKFWASSAVFLFIILSRENMPIWFIFISLTLLFLYKSKRSRLIAAGYGIVSLLYLFLAFKVIIPHYQDPDMPYWGFAYSHLGDNPAEVLKFVITHPWETFKMMFQNHLNDTVYEEVKKEFYMVFLISGGLLLFIRPLFIIPFLPLIAQKMLNDSAIRWGLFAFYSIEIVSILSIFVFWSISKIPYKKIAFTTSVLVCLSSFYITWHKMDERKSWYVPEKEKIYAKSFYEAPFDVRRVKNQLLNIIPEKAKVAASNGIVPHLSQRSYIYLFPANTEVEYIALLRENNPYPLKADEFAKKIENLKSNPKWKILLDDYPLIIFKSKESEDD